jgi:hypothetical protein
MKSPKGSKRRRSQDKGKGKRSKRIILDENKEKKGLKINNKVITSISGPASMVILKPMQKFSTHKNPIFILFGDVHESYSRMCTECNCEGENCCYPIYSKELIKLIDEIAKKHTVYFSTEYGLGDPFEKGTLKETGPITKLANTISLCNAKSRQCFTKNINWQLVDVRKNWKQNYDFFQCMSDLYKLLMYMDDETKSTFFVNNKATEIAQKYQQYREIVLSFMDKDFYKNQFQNLVYKQSAKMSKEWEGYIEKYYEVFWKRVYEASEVNVKLYKDLIDAIFRRIPSPFHRITVFKSMEEYRYKNYQDLITDIFMYTAVSVDLYFILRSFKTTSSKKNAMVSIAYLGLGHTNNIEKFLTEIKGDYEVVYTTSKPRYGSMDVNRCMEIDKAIDLDKMIEEVIE